MRDAPLNKIRGIPEVAHTRLPARTSRNFSRFAQFRRTLFLERGCALW